MVTKHFFKVLFVFTLMIALGLMSMVLIANLDKTPAEAEIPAPLADAENSPCEGENC